MGNECRPSNSERCINCNFWHLHPKVPFSKQQLEYFADRTKDHSRFANQEFREEEKQTKKYFNDISKRCKELFIENPLSIDIKGNEFKGTPDLYAFEEGEKILHVIDYKTGVMEISSEDNMQLLSYAALILGNHNWNPKVIRATIINSYLNRINYVDLDKSKVEEHIFELENYFKFTKANFRYSTAGNWCKWCPAKHHCLLHNKDNLKDYQNADTDRLIAEFRKRTEEMAAREEAIKNGDHSDLLDVRTKTVRVWKDKDNLPENFYENKRTPIPITRLEKTVPKNLINKYIIENKFKCIVLRGK